MQKLVHTTRTLWILVALFNIVYMQGMGCGMRLPSLEFNPREYLFILQRTKELAQEKAIEANTYNQKNKLLKLSDDTLKHTLSYSHTDADEHDAIQSLKKTMQHFIQLKATCKGFSNLLTHETIGSFCKDYDLDAKNTVFQEMLKLSRNRRHKETRLPILLLSCAGADMHIKNGYYISELLRIFVVNSDTEMIKTLLKHQVDPNTKWLGTPVFFWAQTIKTAQLFIDNGVNVHMTDNTSGTNVLWHIINSYIHEYPSELIAFYLKHGVNAKTIRKDDSCLFHKLSDLYVVSEKDHLKRATILLDAIPDMINTVNENWQTPLDVTQQSLERYKKTHRAMDDWDKRFCIRLEQLIALYKEHGAKTAQELFSSSNNLYQLIAKDLAKPMSDELSVLKLLQTHITTGRITPKNIGDALLFACDMDNSKVVHVILAALGNHAAEVLFSLWAQVDGTILNAALCSVTLKTEIVKALIDAAGQNAPSYVCIPYGNSITSLMCAASHGRRKIVQLIIQTAGEKTWHLLSTKEQWDGETALIQAIRKSSITSFALEKRISIIKDLITAAGEHALEYLKMQDNHGLTALDHARIENPEVVVFLEEKLRELTPIECTLCLEEKKLTECHTMSSCNGDIGCKAIFCKDCLIEHVATHLEEGTTRNLRCPNQKCAQKLEEPEIRVITEQRKYLYDRFDTIALKECMADIPNLKHCQTPDCDFGFILEENVQRFKVQCSCNQTYCSHCLFNHSLKISCEQAKEERELAQDPERAHAATQKWIAENTKPCPQCKTAIQKNGGCYWMRCKKCLHEFCWKCLQPHDHTMNHPCGLWEDDVQMNQANQMLIDQVAQPAVAEAIQPLPMAMADRQEVEEDREEQPRANNPYVPFDFFVFGR